MIGISLLLHTLAAVLWVGGMFFAYSIVRPNMVLLDPPLRLTLWRAVLQRFFNWVWLFVVLLSVTGLYLVHAVFAGFASAPWHVYIMFVLAVVMIAVFVYVFFVPYKTLCLEVEKSEWQQAAAALNRIRQLVAVNLVLGITIISVVMLARY